MSVSTADVPGNLRRAGRVADTAALVRVVAELKEINRRTGLDRTLAIGSLVLNQFFGGDPSAWRNRKRNKNNSVRRLAEHSDCPLCRSALNEAVAVYVAAMDLPCVQTYGHVSVSHIAAVLTLSTEDRKRMLEQAEERRWSVRELREEVVLFRRNGGERRGRPRATIERPALSTLRGALIAIDEVVRLLEAGSCLFDAAMASALGMVTADLGSLRDRLMALAGRCAGEQRETTPAQ